MAYQYITSYTSKNFTPAADCASVFAEPRVITGITIHHWGDNGQDFDVVCDFLCTNNTPTSAHYVVMDGKVACLVNPNDVAWHSGNAHGNATTIGIELRPEATDGDYVTAAQLIKELREAYGDLPLYPHNHWFNTSCPGDYDLNRLDALARGASVSTPTASPAPAAVAPAPSGETTIKHGADEIHWVVESGDTLSGISQYYYGDTSHVQSIANYNGIANINALSVGQNVWIPGQVVWIITAPDTVQTVCNYFGVSWQYLAARNPTQVTGPDTLLYIDNVLQIIP